VSLINPARKIWDISTQSSAKTKLSITQSSGKNQIVDQSPHRSLTKPHGKSAFVGERLAQEKYVGVYVLDFDHLP